MRKFKELMRLKFEAGLTHRQIARSLGMGAGTVSRYIHHLQAVGLRWPLPAELSDADIERRLFPEPAVRPRRAKQQPDHAALHQELKRKGVTLALLWEEYYEQAGPERAYRYSQFCERYRRWRKRLKRSMRQTHRAGEKLFVDYAGPTIEVIDPETGEVRNANLFVAALGASSYTFAEATWTQSLPDWTALHVRAFEFFGGCPELVIPDNLRSAVSRAHRYEPDTNPTYHDLARHYGVAVLPARVRRPRDKAKVEVAVQVVERWILAALRHRTFFSLAELNAAIAKLLERLNARAFRKLPGSRPLAVRADRPSGTSPTPEPALRIRAVEEGPGKHRLPRRGRRALLLRPLRPGPAPARSPHHRHHCGVHRPRPARRQPRALLAQRPSHHRRRAYAREAPPDGSVDARALHPLGREDRTAHRRADHHCARLAAPPPAGVSLLLGDPALGQDLRRCTPGGGGAPRAGHRRPQLPQRRIDPGPPPRRELPRATRTRRAGRAPQTSVAPATTNN